MEQRRIWQLAFPEQMLVWAMRRWRQGSQSWATAQADLAKGLGEDEVRPFARALAGLLLTLDIARLTPQRSVPLYCRSVSPDEEDVLAVIRYLHNRMDAAAAEVLGRHLPASARRLALDDAKSAARSMSRWGYHVAFPHRSAPAHAPEAGTGAPHGITVH